MARIRPFRALRPYPELAAKVASPPYDVLSSDEARVMADGNPVSFLHVNKPEIDLPQDTDPYASEVYAKGAENLGRLIEDGVYLREEKPALYLYRQVMGDHVQTGIAVGASVEEYETGRIKKHEHTRQKKEDDRTRHIDALDANTGPVFLTYKARPEIDAHVARLTEDAPVYDFVAPDGIRHTVWVVDEDAERDTLVRAFSEIDDLYVADGHHRSAAATRVCQARRAANPKHTGEEPYNFFLSMIFPDDQMMILDYNRIVRDLNGHSETELLAQIGTKFTVEPLGDAKASKTDILHDPLRPGRAKSFLMYLGGRWYHLDARPGTWPDDPVARLDVAVLQDNLLAPILGIGDPRSDERIDFVGGMRGLVELEKRVDSGEFQVAFALYPTSIADLFAVADAGQVMPPKSTWFEPKLRSGLIVRPLTD
ncbi:MAG: DUF1015 domain-containing protein [Candidatus Eisenbacteria bacterium]|uniref:DUF1015 domain-containing protein n=1 Tax=Eiseniibacteriota bacterium TaxID=2212470 RepID=A0A956NG73_UNCEI|nr:DUF1015 domain-containing protein [Candidatus Eisenbacteria bacterium]